MGEKPLTVMLVEDNPDDIILTKRAIERHNPNFNIDVATNVEECLKKLPEEDYSLVLLDYNLPKRNGLKILKDIRKEGYDIPIIMVTGQGDEMIAVESIKQGAQDYIIKSANYLKILPGTISKVIEGYKLKKEKERLEQRLIQSEKLAGIGTLASGIAHEINNPLQGICGSAEIIRDAEDIDITVKYADDILKLSKRIATIIDNLSLYSRVVQKEEISLVKVNDMIDESLNLMRLSPHFTDIELAKDYKASSVININPIEITQVFMNIIKNSIEAMNGKGRLAISTRDKERLTEVEIDDTGIGIPEDLINRIFEPFYTTKEPGQGTGLGLSVVHRIVERYGGMIDVRSKTGRGTTFTVKLPMW
ncbi:MAG: ATP-binding protein [Nitrospinota bacterium]